MVRGFQPGAVGFAIGPEWDFVLAAPLGAAVLTAEGRIVACNAHLLGLLRLGTVAAQRADALATLVPSVRAALESNAPGTIFERRIELPDAGESLAAVHVAHVEVPLPSGERGLALVAGPATPAHRSVVSRERGARELLDEAPLVFVRLDALSFAPLYVSRRIESWVGIPGEAFAAEPTLLRTLYDAKDQLRWDALCETARAGVHTTADLTLRIANGPAVAVRHHLWPVPDGSGRVRQMEGTLLDITVRSVLRGLRDRIADRSNGEAIRRQLLANVSHELRTPLVGINGYTELLLKEAYGSLTDKQHAALEVVESSGKKLGELIERLLLFRDVEEGRLVLKQAVLDLRIEVGRAVAQLAEAMAKKGIAVEVDLSDEGIPVRGDAERLREVFVALLDNAVKFSESGGAIKVTLRRLATVAELQVRDRGIGIPLEERQRVFERFYQIDPTPTRRFSGAGLGLALARDLILRHGGAVVIDEAKGGGSQFTVRLPLDSGAVEDLSAPSRAHERRLLLIAADPQQMIDLRLDELRGAVLPELPAVDLLFATSEADAVRRARRYRPDAIALLQAVSSRALVELDTDPQPLGVPVAVSERSDAAVLVPVERRLNVDDRAQLLAGLLRLLRPRRLPRAQVVVIEDEPEILDFARFLLEREGYGVTCFGSGEAALRGLDPRTDLVILDLALYDIDGLEVCRQIKRSLPLADVPIIVMTAMSGDEVRRRAMAAGAAGFLSKPFSVEELVAQLRLHLGSSRRGRD